MTQTILIYFVAINLITLAVSIMDKGFAVYEKARIPEKLLLALSFSGGAAGAKLAQIISGHKRLKLDFCVSLSLIAFLQLGAAAAVWSHTVRMQTPDIYKEVRGHFQEEETTSVRRVSKENAMPRRFGPGS